MVSPTRRGIGCLVVAFLMLVAGGIGIFFWLRGQGLTDPVPGQQRCVATAGDQSVTLDLDQAHFTSIIVGLSVRRGLAPRAASIAMATVYQETGIRNLDYGDRDSVGLFQQRPSQGWGTVKQIMDPYYSTGKFYDALVKVKNWETDDINDVAQKVQRSGYPEAYRDHEADARVLASALTGQSPGGFSCLDRSNSGGKTKAMTTALNKSFGKLDLKSTESITTIVAEDRKLAWAYAHFAVANAKYYGVTTVTIGNQQWQTQSINLPTWDTAPEALASGVVEITVR
ncbi:MAG TPA: hypothetical protein VIT20_10950 [Propionibacteriaceae bacterium]